MLIMLAKFCDDRTPTQAATMSSGQRMNTSAVASRISVANVASVNLSDISNP